VCPVPDFSESEPAEYISWTFRHLVDTGSTPSDPARRHAHRAGGAVRLGGVAECPQPGRRRDLTACLSLRDPLRRLPQLQPDPCRPPYYFRQLGNHGVGRTLTFLGARRLCGDLPSACLGEEPECESSVACFLAGDATDRRSFRRIFRKNADSMMSAYFFISCS
jgi:hypothetical protein